MNYLIASHHEWNMQNYIKLKNNTISDHSLFFIDSNSELSLDHLSSINPRYIFFPHWSHIVSNEILDKYDCVCFHKSSDDSLARHVSCFRHVAPRQRFSR